MPLQCNENLLDIDTDKKGYDSTRSLVRIFWKAWVQMRRERGENIDYSFAKCVEIMKINGKTQQVSNLEYWIQMSKEIEEQQQDCSYFCDPPIKNKIWKTFTVALEYPTNEKASPYWHGLYYTLRTTILHLQNQNLEYDKWFLAQDFSPQPGNLNILRRTRNDTSSSSEDDITIELINAMECSTSSPKEEVFSQYCIDLTRTSSSNEFSLMPVSFMGIANDQIILSDNSHLPSDGDWQKIYTPNDDLEQINTPISNWDSREINNLQMLVYNETLPDELSNKNPTLIRDDGLQEICLSIPHDNSQNLDRKNDTGTGSFQSEYIEFLERRMSFYGRRKSFTQQGQPKIRQQFKPQNPCFRGSRLRLQRYLRQLSSSSHQIEPAPAHLPVTYLNPKFPFPAHQALPHSDTLWNQSNLLEPYQAVSCNQPPIKSQTRYVPSKKEQMPYVQIPEPNWIPILDDKLPQSVHAFEKAKNPWIPQPKPKDNNSDMFIYYPLMNNTYAHQNAFSK